MHHQSTEIEGESDLKMVTLLRKVHFIVDEHAQKLTCILNL